MLHFSTTTCFPEEHGCLEGFHTLPVCLYGKNSMYVYEDELPNIGGMILRVETEGLGEKSLYSVRGRWVNKYGALVE